MADLGRNPKKTFASRNLRTLAAPAAIALLVGFGVLVAKVGSDDSALDSNTALTAAVPVETLRIPEAFHDTIQAYASAPLIAEDIVLRRGETFIGALMKAGAVQDDAHAVLSAIRPHFNPRQMQIGQTMSLTFARDGGRKGALQSISFDKDIENRITATASSDGWSADLVKTPLTRVTMRTGGVIDNSLFVAAKRQNIPQTVVADLIRIFSYDVDFQREIKQGDQFELYFERHSSADGTKTREGNILFAKLTLSGKPLTLYRFAPDGDESAEYFHADGRSVKKSLLRTPVDGARLSSGYGARKHPILGYTKVHKGVDFAAPRGTPIMAAGDGVVERANAYGAYGNYVRIRHTNTYATAYAHMNGFAKGVRAGTRVKQGQVIGYVGTTGRSTGPHLHYEVLASGSHVNPLSLKLPTGRSLSKNEMVAFNRSRTTLDTEMAAVPLPVEVAMMLQGRQGGTTAGN